jgi:invasion protein IalB
MMRLSIPCPAKRAVFLRALLPLALALSLAPNASAQQQTPPKPGAKPATTTTPSSKTSPSRTSAKPDAKIIDSKTTASKSTEAKSTSGKSTKGKDDKAAKKVASLGDGKPMLLDTFHDWGAYMAQGNKEKTCYALASPKDRAPSALKRDPAYVFISNRPGENVRNEVSIIMGFAMKDNAEAKAEIGNASYDLVAKGTNAWVKNPAQETQFIDALKKGSKLLVKAPSLKGNVTTDSYSLAGLSQALDRVQKECQ